MTQTVIAEMPELGPFVERKRWSVAFHYRALSLSSRELDRLRQVVDSHLSAGLCARGGKMVLEVLPAIDHDKGTALAWLLDTVGPEHVLAAGDDLTDVAMFKVLAERRAQGSVHGLSVAVLQDVETPDSLLAAADVSVEGVGGLHDLLLTLLEGT